MYYKKTEVVFDESESTLIKKIKHIQGVLTSKDQSLAPEQLKIKIMGAAACLGLVLLYSLILWLF